MLGIYVHLPFCPYICPYCDFAKWPHRKSAADRYLRALHAEIDATPAQPAATIFFGGGTPNAYDAGTLAALTTRLRERFPAARGCAHEITAEVNPELVRAGDFAVYRAAGIGRVSIGVQSFVPGEARTLGRKHTTQQVADAVTQARSAGIDSVSLDLIFGVPGQTPHSWRASLERAVELGVDHVSTYGLTVESGTPFAAWQMREPGAFFDDEREAELYGIAMDVLSGAGLEQYEISNFARPGHACAHNRNYWENGEYLGFGVGAASYGDGVRSVHTRSLDDYLSAVEAGEPIPGESERLDGARRVGEAAMLALRTSQGVVLAAFNQRYSIDFVHLYARVVADMQAAGLVEADETAVRLTQRGRFVANDVCGAFLPSE